MPDALHETDREMVRVEPHSKIDDESNNLMEGMTTILLLLLLYVCDGQRYAILCQSTSRRVVVTVSGEM